MMISRESSMEGTQMPHTRAAGFRTQQGGAQGGELRPQAKKVQLRQQARRPTGVISKASLLEAFPRCCRDRRPSAVVLWFSQALRSWSWHATVALGAAAGGAQAGSHDCWLVGGGRCEQDEARNRAPGASSIWCLYPSVCLSVRMGRKSRKRRIDTGARSLSGR